MGEKGERKGKRQNVEVDCCRIDGNQEKRRQESKKTKSTANMEKRAVKHLQRECIWGYVRRCAALQKENKTSRNSNHALSCSCRLHRTFLSLRFCFFFFFRSHTSSEETLTSHICRELPLCEPSFSPLPPCLQSLRLLQKAVQKKGEVPDAQSQILCLTRGKSGNGGEVCSVLEDVKSHRSSRLKLVNHT